MQTKFFCALVALVSLFACQKEQGDVKFKVNYSLVEENSLTKAIASEQVMDAVAQTLPASISLIFKNEKGATSVVNSGMETSLAPGTYSVTGSSYGGAVGDIINTNCYFTYQPYIVISDQITITQWVSNYTVNGTIKSFAIAVDYDEIASATYQNNMSEPVEVPFKRYDNLGFIYAQGDYSNVPLQITLTPLNTSKYQVTSFGFSTNSTTQKYTYVEPGKYYKLHPAAKGSSGPVVGVAFADFTEGIVKTD